jgi:8-oxo-dGTP diphosphatase
MGNKPEHLGCTVVVLSNRKVLLGKRINSYKSGHFGCPGGRLELTESLIECAKREFLEETGVKAIEIEYVGAVRELQDGYNFIHFTFVCTKWDGYIKEMEPDKCESWDFYSINALPKPILPAHLAGIELANNSATGYVDILEK